MQTPIQVTFRDIPHHRKLITHIEEKAQKFEHFSDDIIHCKIVVTHKKLYDVHIIMKVPDKELVVTHNENADLFASFQKAYDQMVVQLETYQQKRHQQVKAHPTLIFGTVVRIFEHFGFIESLEGVEYYFHADHLSTKKFKQLKPGTKVHFVEAYGHEGPQAHHVSVRHWQH